MRTVRTAAGLFGADRERGTGRAADTSAPTVNDARVVGLEPDRRVFDGFPATGPSTGKTRFAFSALLFSSFTSIFH
ncbi:MULTISPECIES: hypothetical protein [Methylobacterium]|uniref:hypothetical protein n=1 Tax=Methylobacterium TaxID=407 RepID=UPI002F35797A